VRLAAIGESHDGAEEMTRVGRLSRKKGLAEEISIRASSDPGLAIHREQHPDPPWRLPALLYVR
jgi:hypothetical protein